MGSGTRFEEGKEQVMPSAGPRLLLSLVWADKEMNRKEPVWTEVVVVVVVRKGATTVPPSWKACVLKIGPSAHPWAFVDPWC